MTLGGPRVTHVLRLPPTEASFPGSCAPDQPATEAALLACASTVRLTPKFEHHFALIGTTASVRHAAPLGLGPFVAVAPRAGRLAGTARTLAHALAYESNPGCVQTWDAATFDALRRVLRPTPLTPPPDPVPLLPVGPLSDRGSLRAALGLGPEDIALGVLADPPGRIDAKAIVFATGLAEVAGRRLVLLLPAAASSLRRALRFHRTAHRGFPIRVCEGLNAAALVASDFVIQPDAARVGAGVASMRALLQSLGVSVLDDTHEGSIERGWAPAFDRLLRSLESPAPPPPDAPDESTLRDTPAVQSLASSWLTAARRSEHAA